MLILSKGEAVKGFGMNKPNNDGIAVCLLIISVILLFLPVVSGEQGIFRDDLATEDFPSLYFIARNLKQGVIPLWDPHIWCGGMPYYARYYSFLYLLPQLPFYIFVNTENINQAYWVITILPWIVHLIFGAIGAYVLLRRVLQCGCAASFLGAVIYIYSPFFMMP